MDSTRRSLLGAIAASGSLGLPGELFAATKRDKFFKRTGLAIGLQLYTLGDEARADVAQTLARVAAIGYRDIELPELYGRTAAELRAAANRVGIKISSMHVPVSTYGVGRGLSLASSANEIADTLAALGASYAIVPLAAIPEGFNPSPGSDTLAELSRAFAKAGESPWKRTAAMLNEKAAALKPLGISLGYHNHNLEFAPIGKTSGWDILLRECDPGLVSFEVDTGLVATAGLDPASFLDRHRGRVTHLHVKDVAAGYMRNYALTSKSTVIGSGTLDWARILPAAHRAGVRHFYVEQEAPFTIERMEAIRRSHESLARLTA